MKKTNAADHFARLRRGPAGMSMMGRQQHASNSTHRRLNTTESKDSINNSRADASACGASIIIDHSKARDAPVTSSEDVEPSNVIFGRHELIPHCVKIHGKGKAVLHESSAFACRPDKHQACREAQILPVDDDDDDDKSGNDLHPTPLTFTPEQELIAWLHHPPAFSRNDRQAALFRRQQRFTDSMLRAAVLYAVHLAKLLYAELDGLEAYAARKPYECVVQGLRVEADEWFLRVTDVELEGFSRGVLEQELLRAETELDYLARQVRVVTDQIWRVKAKRARAGYEAERQWFERIGVDYWKVDP